MDIKIEGKLSERQHDTLQKITDAVNAGLPQCDKKTLERVCWDYLCGTLDILERRGHNWVAGVDTRYKNTQRIWEEKQGGKA